MNNKFSENLKKIRKENNLSQEQLADELGVSRQAISKWESSVAYPEMDKIITICDKFDVNIDDLLHRDIKEAKGEEESRTKLYKDLNDSLRYITDSVTMFIRMSFGTKLKCLFEQAIIATMLFLLSLLFKAIVNSIFGRILKFLPTSVFNYTMGIIETVVIVFCIIASVIILLDIFKTRYLNYYREENNIQKEDTEEDDSKAKKEEKIKLSKKKNKIIMRDPAHSEYRFFNGVAKVIVGIIKFFAIWIALCIACSLISILICFVSSFLIIKTGWMFVGVALTLFSSALFSASLLYILFNFILNRKMDKKKLIFTVLGSIVGVGIGIGLILIGSLKFEVVKPDENMYKTKSSTIEMRDDLVLYPYESETIKYVESDNEDIQVEYKYSKMCRLVEHESQDKKSIMAWTNCNNPTKIAREFIKELNDKKVVLIDTDIDKITITTSKSNIETIKSNKEKFANRIENE